MPAGFFFLITIIRGRDAGNLFQAGRMVALVFNHPAMQKDKKINSRRKFMMWGASIISGLSLISLGVRAKREKKTVKMLTQDGKLVEVDKSLLTGTKEKISNADLKSWIKNKKL